MRGEEVIAAEVFKYEMECEVVFVLSNQIRELENSVRDDPN